MTALTQNSLRTFVLATLATAGLVLGQPGAASPGRPASTPTPTPDIGPAPTVPIPKDDPKQQDVLRKFEEIEKRTKSEAAPSGGAPDVVVDPKTGQRLQRIRKEPPFYEALGRLFNALIPDREGVAIVRQDGTFYYIAAPAELAPPAEGPQETPTPDPALKPIVSVAAEELEAVAPPVSARKLRLKESSDGLPVSGYWRENFDLVDLDGDRRLEIVSTPPRLSGKPLQVFKLGAKTGAWSSAPARFEDPEGIGVEYGGVVGADMNADGRPDLVFVQHGRGPTIAFNQGKLRFRLAAPGFVKLMTARSLGVGDLDGDGKPDVVALSDEPESVKVRADRQGGDLAAGLPRGDGSVRGFDARAFFGAGDRWEERNDGLGAVCFGFTMALVSAPADGGAPFYASSCRYQNGLAVVVEYDRAAKAFRKAPLDFAEQWAFHSGTAAGLYRGHPAAFMTYVKAGPTGATPDPSGYGVSIYYRESGTWKRKRLLKTLGVRVESQGIAVGDLDGDGLDDVAFADDLVHRIRVFFQRKDGEFEELAENRQPTYSNHSTCVRIGDVDRDGRSDIVLMYQYATGDATRAGGLKFFRNNGLEK